MTFPENDCIDCTIKSITIRRLPEATKERLRIRAARAGLSLEAYSRHILQAASVDEVKALPNMAELSEACFGGKNGIDFELPSRGKDRLPVTFN